MAESSGMVKYTSKNGSSLQVGLDAFPLSWKGPSTVPNVNEVGMAVSVSSRVLFKVTEYSDALVWGGGIGEGQGHRIIALSWDGKASGVITPAGLRKSPAWWAFAGFNHYWSKSFNSNFSTAWTSTDLSPEQSDNTIQRAGSFHANLIWFPYPMVSTGIEYMWGVRQNRSGLEGTATRIQFMAKFKFN